MGFIEDNLNQVNATPSNQVSVEQSQTQFDDRVLALEEETNPMSDVNRLDPIVEYVTNRFHRSRTRRQADEDRWLEAYRNYRGLYGPDVQFSEEEQSRFFIKVTKTKVLAAYAQIVDVLFAGGKFPIGVEPTPESLGDVPDSVYIDPKEQTGGGTPERATLARKELGPLRKMLERVKDTIKEGVGLTPSSATWEPVKMAARKMEKKIHDQLEESDASTHLRYMAFELSLFGHGVIKGPFATDREYPRWGEDGAYSPLTKRVPKISSCSIWNFYPDADAKNMKEAEYVIERHKMSKFQLRELKRRPHFRASSIDEAVERGPNWLPETWEHILEDNNTSVSNESYEVLEYWGVIDRTIFADTELDIPDELQEHEEFHVNAWVCNGQILRLVLNPFTPKRIPYHACPYELNPYSFFGVGVAENMADTQLLMNGTMRMAIDNLALSGNLVFEVDETNLVPGQEMRMYPGKIFRRQGGQTGQSVFALKFPTITNELLQMYDKARQLTDESTSMPSYAHGGVGIQGMGRTAAGMSMLMGAASLNIKAVVRNIDDYILSPMGKDCFAFNMQFDYDKDIVGDLAIIARGTESLMRNEVRSQKILQFLQLTANPMDAPFVKRDYLLRELATSLDLEEDKVVNDPREATVQATLMKKMNDLMGVVPEGGVQGNPAAAPSPQDPTGNGGGNIAPGMAPEPGAQGYTGAGGGANGGNPQNTRAQSASV
jgi:hypothetical protein